MVKKTSKSPERKKENMIIYCNVSGCFIKEPLTNVHYKVFKNNTMHLVGKCRSHGERFLKYEPGLDIPVKYSRALNIPRKTGGSPKDSPRHVRTQTLFD